MKSINVITKDGKKFVLHKNIFEQSITIKNMINVNSDESVPVPNVDSKFFEYFVRFGELSTDPDKRTDEMNDLLDVDVSTTLQIILMANYLDCKELFDSSCNKVASMIRGKTPEEIRETFNIKYDYTPEEVEKVRRDNPWVEG
jgi:S-phase kinase-associated protein 1